MTITIVLILATAGVCVLSLLAIGVQAYRKFRGPMIITCPETHAPAAVAVDSMHAAMTAAVDATELRLKQCSRWPERQDCGQECLRQIEVAPQSCMVRTILADWYADKSCALCGRAFEPIHTWDHQPAMLGADGRTLQCSDIAVERLPQVLATSRPVCWNCHIAEEFRRCNPDLVIDRPLHGESGQHARVG